MGVELSAPDWDTMTGEQRGRWTTVLAIAGFMVSHPRCLSTMSCLLNRVILVPVGVDFGFPLRPQGQESAHISESYRQLFCDAA